MKALMNLEAYIPTNRKYIMKIIYIIVYMDEMTHAMDDSFNDTCHDGMK